MDSFTQITATEAASTLPPGTYSLRVSLGSRGFSDPDQLLPGFDRRRRRALASAIDGAGVYRLSRAGYHLSRIQERRGRRHAGPVASGQCHQNGQSRAFLTMVAAKVAQGLWTSADPAGFSHSVQFLGCGQTPGVLQPGETFRVPVYYAGWQQPWDFAYPPVNWTLGVLKADDPTPVDWSSMESDMRPSSIPADAWHAIFTAYSAQAGTTWGGYVTMLDNNASYLGRLGLHVVDISKLLAFQFMQADGLCPMRTLASSRGCVGRRTRPPAELQPFLRPADLPDVTPSARWDAVGRTTGNTPCSNQAMARSPSPARAALNACSSLTREAATSRSQGTMGPGPGRWWRIHPHREIRPSLLLRCRRETELRGRPQWEPHHAGLQQQSR